MFRRATGCLAALLAFAASGWAQAPPPASAERKAPQRLAGLVVYNPANHHHYQSFAGGISWEEARREAAARSFGGVKGHLATITSQAEYDFIVKSLYVYDYWIGAFRDATKAKQGPHFGWRWITGEPWGYTNWNEGGPHTTDDIPYVASFWTHTMKWSEHKPPGQAGGYVVEYATKGPVGAAKPATVSQEVDRFLEEVTKRAQAVRSYAATVELTFKAHIDTIDAVRAELLMQSDGRFRLEGRGERGRLLAICDGGRLMLALTAPGERMKFVVKPMPGIARALKEAFSLLTSSPKPPSIIGINTGAIPRSLYSSYGMAGEYRARTGEAPEQTIRANISIQMTGEDPIEGGTHLLVDLERGLITESELSFRFKAYPYTVRERHTNIRVNEEIPGNNFVLVITTNAEQVDDLGEGDELELSFSPSRAKR
jgi:hypothetical protein